MRKENNILRFIILQCTILQCQYIFNSTSKNIFLCNRELHLVVYSSPVFLFFYFPPLMLSQS